MCEMQDSFCIENAHHMSQQNQFIRASVDALYRDGANVRGDAHMRKSFHAPRMCEYEPS